LRQQTEAGELPPAVDAVAHVCVPPGGALRTDDESVGLLDAFAVMGVYWPVHWHAPQVPLLLHCLTD
jgi:hypothetical protein